MLASASISLQLATLYLLLLTSLRPSDAPLFERISNEQASHTLSGDFRVESESGQEGMPRVFTLVLYAHFSHVMNLPRLIGQRIIPNNSHYTFMQLPIGVYEIVILANDRELSRVWVEFTQREIDVRKDIVLRWTGDSVRNSAGYVVSVDDFYRRGADTEALMQEALETSRKEDYRNAAELLREITTIDPKDFQAFTELGTMYYLLGKHDDAERAYLHSLQLRPRYPTALLNFGKLQFERKNFEKAIETLGQTIEVNPHSAEAHLLLGESYLQIKKGSKAVAHLEEAIRLDPIGKAEAHLRLAALYDAAGMKDRAADEYAKFLLKRPDFHEREKLRKYINDNRKP